MSEKIKSNLSIILNIVTTVIVVGGLAVSYGQTQGKIDKLEQQISGTERRIDRQETAIREIRIDTKKILCSVGVIEGKLSRTHPRY